MDYMNPTPEHLKQIKALWQLKGDLIFVRKVENWIYYVPNHKVYVRVTDPNHRSAAHIKTELDWMNYLSRQGIPLVTPVPSSKKHFLEEVEHGGRTFLSAVFVEAEGKTLDEETGMTPSNLRTWGNILGRMHQATQNYLLKDGLIPREQWNEDRAYKTISRGLDPKDIVAYEKFQKLESWILSLSKSKEDYGLVHADLHHGNFFVDEKGKFTLLDFDDSVYHWFAYDVAVPIVTLAYSCARKGIENPWEKVGSFFWEGYGAVRPLTDSFRQSVERFSLYRKYVLYYWAMENAANPSFDEKSRSYIEKTAQYCRAEIEKY